MYIKIEEGVVGSKPIVTIEDRGISYQDVKLLRDSHTKFLKWSDIEKIETRTKVSRIKRFRNTFLSADTLDEMARVFIALRGKTYRDSILIPELRLPISFEEFYDLVVLHFWEPKENNAR